MKLKKSLRGQINIIIPKDIISPAALALGFIIGSLVRKDVINLISQLSYTIQTYPLVSLIFGIGLVLLFTPPKAIKIKAPAGSITGFLLGLGQIP